MARSLAIGIAGLGKIARDQHLPAIAAHDGFHLAATADPAGGIDGVEHHDSLDALLAARPDVAAVALCVPPQLRYGLARTALLAGRHVLLEKPPGVTVAEVLALDRLAAERNLSLFATWHSRHALGVAPAKAWCAANRPRRVRVDWREDVRWSHPGQQWIWQPGGFGAFDFAINALSILTEILPAPLRVTRSALDFPANRETPIAARLELAGELPGEAGLQVEAVIDWRSEGDPVWDILVEGAGGRLALTAGGAELAIDGAAQRLQGPGEYADIYDRFAALVAAGERDVDPAPQILTADAFLLGRIRRVGPFED
ncbi:Gfo/Idh/MocA family protein [Marinibaculum pumilum]